jgi:hypothetical protein
MNKTFRQKWVDAGYGSVMGSAEVVLPPPPHLIRLYHLTSTAHAISDIQKARLKVARLDDLNDPFELLALSFKERGVRTVIRDFKKRYGKQTGLLCFSADWTNPVLWSHYGEKHAGICLGFDVPRAQVEKVRYEDERILAHLGDPPDFSNLDSALQRQMLCTKYRHWEYESEYRLFVNLSDALVDGPFHFLPFGPDLQIREVILGPSCGAPMKAIRDSAHALDPDVSVIQARLAFKFFKVVPDERTVRAR